MRALVIWLTGVLFMVAALRLAPRRRQSVVAPLAAGFGLLLFLVGLLLFFVPNFFAASPLSGLR